MERALLWQIGRSNDPTSEEFFASAPKEMIVIQS